jgi:hypothetical protein
MKSNFILLPIAVLTLVSLACGVNINIPIDTDIKTGPTKTDEIVVPTLDDPGTTAEVAFSFGAGEFYLSPGAGNNLIAGEAVYNVDDFKPEVEISEEEVRINQGNLEIVGIPRIDDKVINTWDFQLGQYPMDLTIKAGGYVGDYELGGLSLTNLHVSDGASDVDLSFSQPNLFEMQSLRYETGASEVKLQGLANANFSTMVFQSGAGNYELDFSGTLQRNAVAFVETGLSNLTILVPQELNVEVTVEGGLNNISVRGDWQESGDTYMLSNDGPKLTITVEMGAGNLTLDHP